MDLICGWFRGSSTNTMRAFWGLIDEGNFGTNRGRPWETTFAASEYLKVEQNQGSLLSAYGLGFRYDYPNQVLPKDKELFKLTYTINAFSAQSGSAGVLARIVDIDESIINEENTQELFNPKYEKIDNHTGWSASIRIPTGKLQGAVCLKDSVGAEFVIMAARIN